ncbi:unnamed protein product [Trifolium pratense]|uniref:Uncharacterized protein n=1 Tax=Trifolium pratense TaxID=57577 RepID=A0ACB0LAE8_TRIPR|nr:unnamed protein product [Trifolium pratense]
MASFSDENIKGSGKKLKVHFDLPEDEDYHKEKNSSSSISSHSSLDSNDHNIENFEESNNVGYGSPVWSFQSGIVTQSPPPQLMSPSPNSGYDPNRIPSSAFAPKPTSPMDWSVQSNESLFSLHLGNYSFSREQFFAYKYSGELPKNNDSVGVSTTMPRVQEIKHSNDDNIVEMERHSGSSDSSHDSTNTSNKTKNLTLENDRIKSSNENVDLVLKDDEHDKTETSVNFEKTTLDKTQDDHSKAAAVSSEEPTNYATTVSYRSVESDMSSNHSFQFPILTPEGLRTSSETIESEKHENYEKQHHQQQQMQQSEKPMKSPSPKSEITPKHSSRSWCCCSCFSCSPCF